MGRARVVACGIIFERADYGVLRAERNVNSELVKLEAVTRDKLGNFTLP
jgi:hypothetical protein